MTIQLLTALPMPPLTTDNEATFNEKTDASLLAEKAFVDEMNALTIPGINQAVIDTTAAKNAAAGSATSANDSAVSANTSKDAAQKAVADTTNAGAEQVRLAVAAKNSAEAAAAAAQAAAGLPSIAGKAFMALRVNAAGNGVEWAPGVPNTLVGKTGQSIMLGADKVPYWGYAGQQIGDILPSARNPGALYLPTDGSVRLQASYPDLFALVGLIGGTYGSSWTQISGGTGVNVSLIYSSVAGTLIATTSNNKTLKRSVDNGVTWTPIVYAGTETFGQLMDSDGIGGWMALPPDLLACLVSTDDGVTWQKKTIPSTGTSSQWTGIANVGPGAYILWMSSSFMIRTLDNGATWGGVSLPSSMVPITVRSNGAGVTLISAYNSGPSYGLYRSTTPGGTFSLVASPTTSIGLLANDRQGNWLVAASNGAYCLRSVDDAITFSTGPSFGSSLLTVPYSIPVGYDGFMYFLTAGTYNVLEYDAKSSMVTAKASPIGARKITFGKNGVMFAGNETTPTSVNKSPVSYGYDSATQFRLPLIVSPVGLKSYIKALEAA